MIQLKPLVNTWYSNIPQRFHRKTSVNVYSQPILDGHIPALERAAHVVHFRAVFVDVVHRFKVVNRWIVARRFVDCPDENKQTNKPTRQ